MSDPDNDLQPSKKRAAVVQLTREDPGLEDNEVTLETDENTFKRASDEVMATRKIVKARRHQTSSISSVPDSTRASNPFAGIRLAPPMVSAPPSESRECSDTSKEIVQLNKNDVNCENDSHELRANSTETEEKMDVSSENAKQSVCKFDDSVSESDTLKDKMVGVNAQNISTSLVEEGGGGESSMHGATDGAKAEIRENEATEAEIRENEATEAEICENEARKDLESKINEDGKESNEETTVKKVEASSFSSFQQLSSGQNAFAGLAGAGFATTGTLFGFGVSKNGIGTSGENIVIKAKSSKSTSMQEVTVETGEENETSIFRTDSVMYEYVAGSWKERGKGELKVNVSTAGAGKTRLVMRARGNYRLILNAYLYPDMKLTNTDKKGITFACMNNAEVGKDGLSTIALKFKDASMADDFRGAVTEHKAESLEAAGGIR